jgi:hypothetical protein
VQWEDHRAPRRAELLAEIRAAQERRDGDLAVRREREVAILRQRVEFDWRV